MNNITLFTVVYPGCKPYLDRFFRSVREQEMQEFNLLVLNDGLENLESYAGDLYSRTEEISVSGTIAEVRQQGLRLLMDRPEEKIVFADADDYISTDRIQKANKVLESYDIYVNDLTTVTENEKIITENYLKNRLGDSFKIEDRFILKKNIIGLGNTSVRRTMIRDIQIPPSTVAVDWMIFTDMLLRGASAIFKADSISYYRQHNENTAGLKNLSPDKIRRGLNVQIQNAEYFAAVSESHKIYFEKLIELRSFLARNKENINLYMNKLEEILPDYPLWWEEVKTLDQLYI